MRRKIVLMSETEREAFLNYCEAIRNMESDKDTFLESSRLSRHEVKPQLTQEQTYWVQHSKIWARVVMVLVVGFFIVCLRGCAL